MTTQTLDANPVIRATRPLKGSSARAQRFQWQLKLRNNNRVRRLQLELMRSLWRH